MRANISGRIALHLRLFAQNLINTLLHHTKGTLKANSKLDMTNALHLRRSKMQYMMVKLMAITLHCVNYLSTFLQF